MQRAGRGEARVRLTIVTSSRDQESMGPRGVEAQSKARTRSAISPSPRIRLEDGEGADGLENPFDVMVSKIVSGMGV